MIPVKPQPEPDIFDELVRTPGKRFLKKCAGSTISYKQWKSQDYWKNIRTPLYNAYKHICAYSAHWIPSGSSIANVDHFIPKSVKPELAYEWSNYRLACPLVNTLKKDYQDVLDPFTIHSDWFFLDFPSLLLKPNPQLPPQDQQRVQITIERLKLNEDQTFVRERSAWLEPYCQGEASFAFLKKSAPFIAYELERQDLVENIKTMMEYEPEVEEVV